MISTTVLDFVLKYYSDARWVHDGSKIYKGPFRRTANTLEDANAFHSAQPERWNVFIQTAIRRLGEISPDTRDDYKQPIEGLLRLATKTLEADEHYGLEHYSKYPLLDDPHELKDDSADLWARIAALFVWFGHLLAEQKLGPDHDQRAIRLFCDPRLQVAMMWMTRPRYKDHEHLASLGYKAGREIADARETLGTMKAELDAAIKKVREDTIFKSASLLWQQKATWHTAAYVFGFLVVLTSLGSIAYGIDRFAATFLAAMPLNKVTGEYSYFAIVVVGLMFVALAWVYRMLGRFVMDNFTLASDARQRQTILQTFLTLVGTPEAKMKEGERVLILSAIFRPAPGQGADDPAPSSLMDLMKGALPTGGAGEKKA